MRRSPRPILKGPGPIAPPTHSPSAPVFVDAAAQLQGPDGTTPFPFAACSSTHAYATHVHYPPTPKMSCTRPTYSAKQYDRAPIHVSPNVCALPGRNEREYAEPARQSRHPAYPSPAVPGAGGSYFSREPDAYGYPQHLPPAPALGLDLSSESDESPVTTPPDPLHPSLHATHSSYPALCAAPSIPSLTPRRAAGSARFGHDEHPSEAELSNALAFLPHPPVAGPGLSPPKERKRRSATPCARGPRRSVTLPSAAGGFASPELDGCLGGF